MVMARLKGVSGVGVFRRLQRAGLGVRSQEGRAEEGTQIGSERRSSGKYLSALHLASEPLSRNGLEGAEGWDPEMPFLTWISSLRSFVR